MANASRCGVLDFDRDYLFFGFKMTKREKALKIAWHFLGTFYTWGGDDPSGFDCSGFICEILQSTEIIDHKSDYTARSLYEKFKHRSVAEAKEGVLVFYYHPNKGIFHVEMCLDEESMIGASGGSSKTLTKADAIKHNAFIKIRPFWAYPKIFVDVFNE